MTRNEAKAMWPILQAYSEGKKIQYKDANGNWSDSEHLNFLRIPEEYRIKPEPRRFWINVYPDRAVGAYPSREYAESVLAVDGHVVEVVEVIKE